MKHFTFLLAIVNLSGCAGLPKKGLKGPGPSSGGPGLVGGPKGSSSCNKDIPQILPAFTKGGKPISYGGHTYEGWAEQWWMWMFSFNNTVNPLGNVSKYAYLLQPKGTFFLGFDGSSLHLDIPKDTSIFFPIAGQLHWYNPPGTDDAKGYEKVAMFFLGTNINYNASLAEISIFFAHLNFLANTTTYKLTLEVDGCKLDPYQNGVIATSLGEEFTLPSVFTSDNDALPGNFGAAQVGYWIRLAPFKKIGKHTIHFSASVTRSGLAAAADALGLLGAPSPNVNITYYLNAV
jgi:hypothetical protein